MNHSIYDKFLTFQTLATYFYFLPAYIGAVSNQ